MLAMLIEPHLLVIAFPDTEDLLHAPTTGSCGAPASQPHLAGRATPDHRLNLRHRRHQLTGQQGPILSQQWHLLSL
jgi:hypothetical protein